MDKFSMTTPLTGEYFTTVRLAVGGICSLAGFDVDTAEDFKVCVTESLLILKRNGYLSATVELALGESLRCKVYGVEEGGERVDGAENEISRALLSALLGTVEFVADGEKLVSIVFEG